MTGIGLKPHLLALVFLAGGCRPEPEPPKLQATIPVHCATAEAVTVDDIRSLRGTVVTLPNHDAIVAAQVPGKILKLLPREGDRVEAGAIVAEIEVGPLREALVAAEAQLAQARALRGTASIALEREKHLFDRGIHARQTMEAAQDALAHGIAMAATAKSQVDVARQSIERTHVRAPLSGIVVRVMRQIGEIVDGTPGTPLLEIADPSELELAAAAPAVDLIALKVGQQAVVFFDELAGRHFAASVQMVSPAVDASGLGAVRLALIIKDVRPPLGLLGRADVSTGEARSVVEVPVAAVRNAGGVGTEVVVCDAGQARVATVRVGTRGTERIEILEGLAAGQRVAVDEVVGLEDGAALEELP